MKPLQKLVILFLVCYAANCANIFCVFFAPSISHQRVFQPVYKELSLRGHKVTVVTPNPLKDESLTNLTEIDVSYLYKHSSFISTEMNTSYPNVITKVNIWMEYLIELILQDPNVKNVYKEKIDAVMVQAFSPLLYVFGAVFDAPVIGFTTTTAFIETHAALGSLTHPVLFGDMVIPYAGRSLVQKIQNTYYFLWYKWHYQYVIHPRCDRTVRKYFSIELPKLRDMEKKISIVFMNMNFVIYPVRPTAPNAVPLGFVHLKPTVLSPDLKVIMDNAKEGIVYMSLGSNVKSSTLQSNLIDVIVETLSDLPYTVLWKWETEDIPNVGKNVITRKWFPQQAVLGHPNVKVFITQGGLQSIEEAIANAVPMVGIPFVADQMMNVNRLTENGIALEMNAKQLTKQHLKDAILDVAQNPKYKEKIEEIRDVILDQPMTGLERAVWWTEYVIRHKGAKHLRSAVADTPLWEFLMLDVIAVVLIFLIVNVFLVYKMLYFILNRLKKVKAVYNSKIKPE